MRTFTMLLICCFSAVKGFSQTTEAFLYGKWTVEKIVEEKNAPKTVVPDSIKNSYKNAVFTFTPDKKFSFSNNLNSMKIEDAGWKYDRDTKTIFVSADRETMQPVLMEIKVTNNLDGSAYFLLGTAPYKLKTKNIWRAYLP